MKKTLDDALKVLKQSEAAREKMLRQFKKAGVRVPEELAAHAESTLAAVRTSLREARIEDEVERRQGARSDRLLRAEEVARLTGLHRSSLWRLERQGDFPKRVRLTKNTVAWRESEVAKWIALRRGARV